MWMYHSFSGINGLKKYFINNMECFLMYILIYKDSQRNVIICTLFYTSHVVASIIAGNNTYCINDAYSFIC